PTALLRRAVPLPPLSRGRKDKRFRSRRKRERMRNNERHQRLASLERREAERREAQHRAASKSDAARALSPVFPLREDRGPGLHKPWTSKMERARSPFGAPPRHPRFF